MGVTIRERPKNSGVWWIFVCWQGKRKAKKVGHKEVAEEAARKIQARLTLGEAAFPQRKPPAPTLKEYYKVFTCTYLKTAVRHSTRQSYVYNVKNHILPALGDLKLDLITRQRTKQFVACLVEKGLARATIAIIIAQLSSMMSQAKDDGIIQVNPAARLRKFYSNAPASRHIEPLTAEEARALLQAALKHYPAHYPMLLCSIHTGMRMGELVGLQWGDVDDFGSFITVRRNIVRRRINETKTGRIRRIDMSDALRETLKALKRQRREQWLARGENSIPKWVFCCQNGNFMDPYNFKTYYFEPCLEKAKLRRIRFHDLRHSFASLLIQAGHPLAYIKEQLGHSSIRMTVDVYGHLVPGAHREVMNTLPTEKGVTGEALEQTGSG